MASLAEELQGGPYPHPDDDADLSNDLKDIVEWAAERSVMRFSSTTERDSLLPSPIEGQVCATGSGTGLVLWLYANSAWRQIGPVENSSPVALTKEAGLSGSTVYIQRRANMVELWANGNVSGTFTPGLSDIIPVGGIPADWRPSSNRWGAAYFSSSHTGAVVARANGSVSVAHQSGSNRTTVQFSITWTL